MMQRHISKLTWNNRAMLMAASRYPFIYNCSPFSMGQWLYLQSMSGMSSISSWDPQHHGAADPSAENFDARKWASSGQGVHASMQRSTQQIWGNRRQHGRVPPPYTDENENVEGFVLVDYEPPVNFILINTPQTRSLVTRLESTTICPETGQKILQMRPPPSAYPISSYLADGQRSTNATQLVNQQIRHFAHGRKIDPSASSKQSAYAKAKGLFKTTGTKRKQSVGGSQMSPDKVIAQVMYPRKSSSSVRSAKKMNRHDKVSVLRVVPKEF